jgi:hypothetical protein
MARLPYKRLALASAVAVSGLTFAIGVPIPSFAGPIRPPNDNGQTGVPSSTPSTAPSAPAQPSTGPSHPGPPAGVPAPPVTTPAGPPDSLPVNVSNGACADCVSVPET